jgi:hypothetical protein
VYGIFEHFSVRADLSPVIIEQFKVTVVDPSESGLVALSQGIPVLYFHFSVRIHPR